MSLVDSLESLRPWVRCELFMRSFIERFGTIKQPRGLTGVKVDDDDSSVWPREGWFWSTSCEVKSLSITLKTWSENQNIHFDHCQSPLRQGSSFEHSTMKRDALPLVDAFCKSALMT